MSQPIIIQVDDGTPPANAAAGETAAFAAGVATAVAAESAETADAAAAAANQAAQQAERAADTAVDAVITVDSVALRVDDLEEAMMERLVEIAQMISDPDDTPDAGPEVIVDGDDNTVKVADVDQDATENDQPKRRKTKTRPEFGWNGWFGNR